MNFCPRQAFLAVFMGDNRRLALASGLARPRGPSARHFSLCAIPRFYRSRFSLPQFFSPRRSLDTRTGYRPQHTRASGTTIAARIRPGSHLPRRGSGTRRPRCGHSSRFPRRGSGTRRPRCGHSSRLPQDGFSGRPSIIGRAVCGERPCVRRRAAAAPSGAQPRRPLAPYGGPLRRDASH
jgi:hypothetical protein